MTGKRVMIDTSKCTACRACMVSCKQWHSLPAEDTTFTGTYQNPPDLSGATLTLLRFIEKEKAGKVKWLFFNNRCRHCEFPPCKGVCPKKAIKRQSNGIVRIDPALCDPATCSPNELKPCQGACPFKTVDLLGVPRLKYMKDGSEEGEKMRKCDFCYDRLKSTELKSPPFVSSDGKTKSALPACQVTCPPGAITSGAADAIMTKAKSRVNYLKNHGHPNANVYPEGYLTHVIWILLEPPSEYGISF